VFASDLSRFFVVVVVVVVVVVQHSGFDSTKIIVFLLWFATG
jgi:hypothetical protein